MGHAVVAIEPTAELRLRAARIHPSPRIEWQDDSLPDLTQVAQRGEQFDLVCSRQCGCIWMNGNDGAQCAESPPWCELTAA